MSSELRVTIDFTQGKGGRNIWTDTGCIRLEPAVVYRKQYRFLSDDKIYHLDANGNVDAFHCMGTDCMVGCTIRWRFAGWRWEVHKIATAVALALQQQQKRRMIPRELRNLVVFAVLDS